MVNMRAKTKNPLIESNKFYKILNLNLIKFIKFL